MEDRFEQLRSKYKSTLNFMQFQNVQLQFLGVKDNKLFIRGIAPSPAATNKVWDQIKLAHPNYSDLIADIQSCSRWKLITMSKRIQFHR